MTEDRTALQWGRLADAIKTAREARGLRQADLADLAGISEGSVQNLEAGEARRRIPPSLSKVEPHLGWAPDSGLAVLNGGEPTRLQTAGDGYTPAEARLRQKLPLRVVDDLESDDPLIDSQVIQLPGTAGARMTVIVHGQPDATPEEIQEALLAWRKTERRLRHLVDDEDTPGGPRAANGS